ncbi:hypothetical protein HY635_04280 [Candidatus Uhrbacteria bacterium]|nr:hypothetical protein [Candidatus Uhrbacteria bacterium]
MARRRGVTQQVRRLTLGVCDSVVDACLFNLFSWTLFMNELPRMGRAKHTSLQATYLLDQFNAQTIRRAFYRLRERGLITSARYALQEIHLTAVGRKWLAEQFPVYHAERPWDRRMYLVTYDLPERRRYLRDQLRDYLRQIRCAPLQASVWITPYNPRKLLREYVQTHQIPGVIISSFERGSFIGEVSYRDLVASAYHLLPLNDRYERFLRGYRQRRDAPVHEITAAYLGILTDDPQLPFALLPEWWLGDEAHAFVTKRCQKSCKQWWRTGTQRTEQK